MIDSLQLTLSNMQGQLFEMSVKKGLDSKVFIKAFMLSDVAKDLDSKFNHMQWAGKEYIMERILDELKDELIFGGEIFDQESMYWTGYVYRYWRYYTGETSKQIYRIAPADTMVAVYFPYHTMSVEMAIDRLKESYWQKHKRQKILDFDSNAFRLNNMDF